MKKPSQPETPSPESNSDQEADHAADTGQSTKGLDLARYRIGQDFAAATGVSEVVTTVDVRRPRNQEWFRVHPDPAWCISVAVLVAEQERETFLVDPSILASVRDEVVAKMLVTCITREGQPIIWPIKLPDSFGRLDTWNLSALAACEVAKSSWTRLASDCSRAGWLMGKRADWAMGIVGLTGGRAWLVVSIVQSACQVSAA